MDNSYFYKLLVVNVWILICKCGSIVAGLGSAGKDKATQSVLVDVDQRRKPCNVLRTVGLKAT